MTTLVEYDALLSRADFHYQHSDDPGEYRRGAAAMFQLGLIALLSAEHGALLTAWTSFAHSPIPVDQARVILDATRRALGVLA